MGKIMDKLREITSERYRISTKLKAVFVLVLVLTIGLSLLVGGIIMKRSSAQYKTPGTTLAITKKLAIVFGGEQDGPAYILGNYLGPITINLTGGQNPQWAAYAKCTGATNCLIMGLLVMPDQHYDLGNGRILNEGEFVVLAPIYNLQGIVSDWAAIKYIGGIGCDPLINNGCFELLSSGWGSGRNVLLVTDVAEDHNIERTR